MSSNWYIFRGLFLIYNLLTFLGAIGLVFFGIFFASVDYKPINEAITAFSEKEFQDKDLQNFVKQFSLVIPKIEIITIVFAALFLIKAAYFISKSAIAFRAHSAVSIACYRIWNVFTMIEIIVWTFFFIRLYELGIVSYLVLAAFFPKLVLHFMAFLMPNKIISTAIEEKYK